MICIDSRKGVYVSPEKYNNEINALMQLKAGLIFIYNVIRPHEKKIVADHPNSHIEFFGRAPELPKQFFELLPCLFHWYGTSICNYARLAGYIVGRELNEIAEPDSNLEPDRKGTKIFCDQYITNFPELEEVLKWRNKVSAHFSLTDPRKEDNIATLEASIIYPVGFKGDRFMTGTMVFSRGAGDIEHSSQIPTWSVTNNLEILSGIFWPDIIFS